MFIICYIEDLLTYLLLWFENFELFVFVFGGSDAGVKLLTNFHGLFEGFEI